MSAGQTCVFTDCEIAGNLTINGTINKGGVSLDNCTVDGNATENGGLLVAQSTRVKGNLKISGPSSFRIGTGVVIGNNLHIHSLVAGLPQPGTVCGTRVNGNLQANNNASPIALGGPGASCMNTVIGNLQCSNNTGLTQGQCFPQ